MFPQFLKVHLSSSDFSLLSYSYFPCVLLCIYRLSGLFLWSICALTSSALFTDLAAPAQLGGHLPAACSMLTLHVPGLPPTSALRPSVSSPGCPLTAPLNPCTQPIMDTAHQHLYSFLCTWTVCSYLHPGGLPPACSGTVDQLCFPRDYNPAD